MGLVVCLWIGHAADLVLLGFGACILITGKVYLTSFSKKPLIGAKARWLGLLCVVISVLYFAVIYWQMYHFDR
jgi:hypothetical protein